MLLVYLLTFEFSFIFKLLVLIVKNKRLNLNVWIRAITIFFKLIHFLVKIMYWHYVLIIRTNCYLLWLVSLLKCDKIVVFFYLLIFLQSHLCNICISSYIHIQVLFFYSFLEPLDNILTFRWMRQLLWHFNIIIRSILK
jgi:hypothetical protein